jgi:hypothetical protein
MRERRGAAVLKCASPGSEIGFGVIKATFFVRTNARINALATSTRSAAMMMYTGTTHSLKTYPRSETSTTA